MKEYINNGGAVYQLTKVQSLKKQNGKWNVLFNTINGEKSVLAKNVILSAGTIGTAQILRQSAISKIAGRNFQMHPTIKVVAVFNEKINEEDMGVPIHQVKEFAPDFSIGCSISSKPYLRVAMLDHPEYGNIVEEKWKNMAIYYSMIIPDIDEPGEYDVEIKYSWANYGTSISDFTKINFELFPYIITDPVNLENINLNENTSIAIIESYLDDEKYFINSEDIQWSVSTDAIVFDISINPIDSIQDGRASKFEAVLSTTKYGKAHINFRLDSMYKNKKYVVYSNSIVITTIPEPIIEKVVVKEEPKEPTNVIQDKIEEQSNLVLVLSVIVGIVIILILITGIILMINYSRRVSLRGYIYDNKNNLIIDINSIPRSLLNKILNRNKIRGEDLNNELFNGLLLEYTQDSMIIHNHTGKSLRINNQPLIDEKEIFNKAWLGISGKLLLYSDDKL